MAEQPGLQQVPSRPRDLRDGAKSTTQSLPVLPLRPDLMIVVETDLTSPLSGARSGGAFEDHASRGDVLELHAERVLQDGSRLFGEGRVFRYERLVGVDVANHG